MAGLSRIITFIAVVLTVLGSLHYYFWARLIRDTALPPMWRQVATGSLILLAVSMPCAFFLARAGGTRLLVWPAFIWMGLILLLFITLMISDAIYTAATTMGVDPARRLYLRRLLSGAAALA